MFTLQNFIINDDCKHALRDLIHEGIGVDSIVTDPPYEMGFMGKQWDKSGIAYDVELWQLCLQILKPGGHLLAFGGARTYHRMACAIEDAGFEIRDQIMWLYGQGFPKSLDISKAIDKASGAQREKKILEASQVGNFKNRDDSRPFIEKAKETGFHVIDGDIPATDDAKTWQGWGTALKPAHEPIVLARKPIAENTIAANVLKQGTGAINIDACRIAAGDEYHEGYYNQENQQRDDIAWCNSQKYTRAKPQELGRFPANVLHDGSEEVINVFPEASGAQGIVKGDEPSGNTSNCYDACKCRKSSIPRQEINKSAARFFYCAKASKKERNGSKHPCVKPLALMQYLCRLITPPGGIVLDPFAGTGTTGQAAIKEGFRPILIEREAEYIKDIEARVYG